jgi:hypothetical protein
MWASNQTNVDRTNAIIKTIAGMFKDNPANVPIIAPLNEYRISSLFIWLALLMTPADRQGSIKVFYQLRSSTGKTHTATSDTHMAHQSKATPSN